MAVASESVAIGYFCALEEPTARDAEVSGSKAASLARALGHGLPVVPGFVITTRAHTAYLDAGWTHQLTVTGTVLAPRQ